MIWVVEFLRSLTEEIGQLDALALGFLLLPFRHDVTHLGFLFLNGLFLLLILVLVSLIHGERLVDEHELYLRCAPTPQVGPLLDLYEPEEEVSADVEPLELFSV